LISRRAGIAVFLIVRAITVLTAAFSPRFHNRSPIFTLPTSAAVWQAQFLLTLFAIFRLRSSESRVSGL